MANINKQNAPAETVFSNYPEIHGTLGTQNIPFVEKSCRVESLPGKFLYMSLIVFNKLDTIVRGKSVLKDISWAIEPCQNWVIVGPNGAGKTSLLNIILGKLYYRGDFFIAAGLREHTSYVSFDRHSALIRKEAEKDHARYFSGRLDEGLVTPANLLRASAEAIGKPNRVREVIALLGISSILNREIRRLSTGEMRKLLIADALITQPELLILDEPYDGLDPTAPESPH